MNPHNEIARLRSALESAVQQAQSWKMEAAAHHSSLCEAYQAVTGATGEPGTWHGAEPIREALSDDAYREGMEAAAKIAEAARIRDHSWDAACTHIATAIREASKARAGGGE